MSAPADHNLLFGILALQMDFISRDQLVTAMNAWVLAKHRPLADLLAERQHLRSDHRVLLEALVQAQLDRHGGDARETLGSIRPTGGVEAELDRICDTDLEASLRAVVSAQDQVTRDPNRTWSLPMIGQSTSDGRRFQILRPHAEGGLGRVSIAHDEELHREVALKEIHARYADDPENRARFLLEAEVTGGLEHPGVVPVYGLGHDTLGRPYYAMRFIRGDTLKEVIERFHSDAQSGPRVNCESLEFRQLLARFVAVCNTVAYAHSRRVLHRDLKPANIVLGKYGETLVVDWGLAKMLDSAGDGRLDPPTEPPLQPAWADNTGETLPGAAIGTPGYMSPEQAAGRWDVVGPASDIFSLGATFYAILTGRPPFDGQDVGEVLQRVEKVDYIPPRLLVPTVPAALEAVCQKAMAASPKDRYGSALELAADVEHWLADEPIAALPEPMHVRMRRWARRHRPIVTGAGTLLVMAIVLLVGLYIQADRARHDVGAERDRAVAARNQTRQALDAMLSEKSLGWLETQKELLPQQRAFLERVLGYYEQFAAEPGEDELGRQRLASAHFRVASLQSRLGRHEDAEKTIRRCGEIVNRLAADDPSNPNYRNDVARVHQSLGILLATSGRLADAAAEYRSALENWRKLEADFPKESSYRLDEATVLNNLAVTLKDWGRREDAETAFRDGIRVRERLAEDSPKKVLYRQEVARARVNLGALLSDLNRPADAETEYRAALPVLKALADEFPLIASYRQDLARTYHNLGYLLEDLKRPDQAEAAYQSALTFRAKIAADAPALPANQQELARSQHALGEFFRGRDRPAEADAQYRAALAIRRTLAETMPGVPQYRQELADTLDSLGSSSAEQDRRAEAEAAYREALTIREKLVKDAPDVTAYRQDVGRSLANLGTLSYEAGNAAAALEWYDKAVAGLETVLKTLRGDVATGQSLRGAHAGRARALGRLGRPREAIMAWDQAFKVDVGPPSAVLKLERAAALARAGDGAAAGAEADSLTQGADLPVLAGSIHVYAIVAGSPDSRLAEQSAKRAIALLRQVFASDTANPTSLMTDADFNPLRARADFVDLLWDLADTPAAKQ